jgi:hypothetical protein
MPKWTEYTSKDTLADNDEVMLYDATARANKRGLMSKIWDYMVNKMATAVISKLETDNKTIIGAINLLNGKTSSITLKDDISTNSFARCIVFGRLCLVYMALYPKEAFNDGDVLVDLSVSAKEMTFAAINSGLADSYIQVSGNQIYYKGTQNSSRIRGEILFLINQ